MHAACLLYGNPIGLSRNPPEETAPFSPRKQFTASVSVTKWDGAGAALRLAFKKGCVYGLR
jgi:hypothetical protein